MMSSSHTLMVWKDDYSVEIREFDLQHQKLVSLINELHSAMMEGKSKELLHRLLDDLVKYAQGHFAAEECRMRESEYPDFLAHQMEHDRLTHQMVEFQKDFEAGHLAISVQLMDFLRDWLVNHINGMDKKYSPHLKSHGVV